MDEQGFAGPDSEVPLVLRRMPPERQHLARSMTAHPVTPGAGTWWELVDAAAADDASPAGVALTHAGPDGDVTVSALGAADEDEAALAELLRALTAVLRCSAAALVVVRSPTRAAVPALVAAGFTRALGDVRYVLAL